MNASHNQTAIFVDLENLRLGVFEKANKKKKIFFDYTAYPQKVVDFCNVCVFYTAKTMEDHVKRTEILSFLNKLESLNHTALRLGKLVKREGVVVQKQVDMLLGIDMAEISLKHFVKKVVLLGYDSDMSPALKLARTNGIQTEIVVFADLAQRIEPSLTKHCDFIKEVKIEDIYKKIEILNTEQPN